MHRILVAHDGSVHADRALTLVAGLPWPPGSVVRLVTVVPAIHEIRRAWAPLALDGAEDLGNRLAERAETILAPARDRLASLGLAVESVVAEGRPPQAIAMEAGSLGANLVVVGSRGLGPIEGTILGSVSAEVIDIAPCPVLVARQERLTSVVLATDGSPSAGEAERFLASLPVPDGVPVSVVSVAEIVTAWNMGLPIAGYGHIPAVHEAFWTAAEQTYREIGAAAADRLRAAGRDARVIAVAGDPAAEILAASRSLGADLVVLGTRGRTGLQRIVLGSVARRVLQHASASVLVVRRGTAGETSDVPEEAPQAAG